LPKLAVPASIIRPAAVRPNLNRSSPHNPIQKSIGRSALAGQNTRGCGVTALKRRYGDR
jgi:hypothetical protein